MILDCTKGIIFDVDGTLWDSSEAVANAWNLALANHPELARRVTQEEIRGLMGQTMDVIYERLFPGASETLKQKLTGECRQFELKLIAEGDGIRLFPQEEETLSALAAEYPLYIVSNCRNGYIEALLSYTGYGPFFADFECFGRTGKLKADNIRLLAGRAGLKKALYVGDTQLDFDSSAQAGVPFLHAAYGFGSVPEAQHSVSAFAELGYVIPEIF